MRSLLLFITLISSFTYVSAQDTAHIVDRVSTSDNKSTMGQITMDKKGDFLLINIYGHGIDTITYSRIVTVEYGIDNPIYDSTAHTDSAVHSGIMIDSLPKPIIPLQQRMDSSSIVINSNNIAPYDTKNIYYPERHKAGIAFTFGGIVLMGAGAALIALTPKVAGSSFGKSITPGTAAGFIMVAAGIGMTIPGAIIWSRYPHGDRHKK